MTKRDMSHYYRYYNTTKNRNQCKKVFLILCLLSFFCYFFVDYNLRTKLLRLRDRFDFIARITDTEYNVTQAYFVNTPGCRMPYFEVTDDNILQFMFTPENYSCKKALTRTSDIGAKLWLNMNKQEMSESYNITQLNDINCKYTELVRQDDDKNVDRRVYNFKLDYERPVYIKPGIEFIRVECSNENKQMIYKDFHFFAVKKKYTKSKHKLIHMQSDVENSTKESFANIIFNKQSSKNDSKNDNKRERISVMILGIDSVSHLNFLRQMPQTANFINKKPHAEFWGFNKVGDNTYPNLIPMLSGLDDSELNISCLAMSKPSTYDKCSLIWNRYKEAGFKTLFAEDVSWLGLFNYLRNGFIEQPTDYYLRPIMNEMERHISYEKTGNTVFCMAGRRTFEILPEYIRKLLPLMRMQHFFSVYWSVSLTHDYMNMPRLMDQPMLELFKTMEMSGIFNNTFIFLTSDHGLRWGSYRKTYQGMMEERQPLLIAIYPQWFKEKYPLAINNLINNTRRLTTHFDIYATLLDLVDLRNLENSKILARGSELTELTESLPRALSLFLPVPETRNCENAAIASHWCTCHQKQELVTNDPRVRRAARYIVKLINERLKAHPQCRILYLNSILEAIVAAPYHKIVKEVTNDYAIDITVRIQTKPGLGNFESTVRMSSYSIGLTGTISRINLYGSQSYCINDYALKMFCYCHR